MLIYFGLAIGMSHIYNNIECVSESLCKLFAGSPMYGNCQPAMQWPFIITFKCFLQVQNSVAGRAYRGEVLTQI